MATSKQKSKTAAAKSEKHWSVGGGMWLQYLGNDQFSERRLALLEGIADSGSISQAAKSVGLSYKAAWDAVDAMNNLAEKPLVSRAAGGKHGGGTQLTEYGMQLLQAYRHASDAYQQFLKQLDTRLFQLGDTSHFLRALSMRTSARNQFGGKVSVVKKGAVNGDVILDLGDGLQIFANITNEAIDELQLQPGVSAFAIIKSSFILLSPDENVRISARNRLSGTIIKVISGAVNGEVKIELAGGRILTAIVTNDSLQEFGFAVGQRCCALIKSSHVLIGIAG